MEKNIYFVIKIKTLSYSMCCMIFDVDRAGAAIDWADRHCPAPNLTLMNLLNACAHLAYLCETGICTAPDANNCPAEVCRRCRAPIAYR
ncbi:replication initiation protein, partial [Arsenophonus endosymbiont of Bemisia tabaci]|uniref:replication initiation protein n=1 Tax=Arsenophonus endosymbiont of Bemisia tabaci TaxID=536059 RepID=UPI001EE2F6D1